jgi:hypothetical protein
LRMTDADLVRKKLAFCSAVRERLQNQTDA